MKCGKCGVENADTNKYCVICGELLEQEVSNEKCFCTKCGAENTKDSKFCVTCGAAMSNQTNVVYVPQSNPFKEDSSALGLGIASLSVSIVCCCVVFVAQILSIIFGAISIKRALKYKSSKNTTGMILSIVGICISVYMIFSFIVSIASGEFQAAFEEGFNAAQNGYQMVKMFLK